MKGQHWPMPTPSTTIKATPSRGGATEDKEAAAIAQQINASRAAGTRCLVADGAEAAGGSVTDAATPSTAAITAVVTNAPRQLPRLAKVPPTSGPSKTETLQLVVSSAMVRLQICSGNVERITT